ncbi:hypothetical protein TM7_0529 [candidate division TM7 genomosp. GTL1]|nr:hypothetical protein TM7_0529 [candidate division TM7 genomosp. GTL1]
MKTLLLNKRNLLKGLLVKVLLGVSILAQAQNHSVPELEFKNPTRESGAAGADGTIYRFKNVVTSGTNIDALVMITQRSSPLVTVSSIDINNTGNNQALQPQIAYNGGNAPRNTTWWVDFDVSFVKSGTNTPIAVSSFNLTALDVDGDGGNLNESVGFYNSSSYILENNSLLSVQSIWATILSLLTPGREFNGPRTNYEGIDVNATRVMTTVTFNNKSYYRMRLGGSTSILGGSPVADRMYSFWFKGFNFSTPVLTTLPVKLYSFTATLNDGKADLKWITSMEKDVSHFVIEKSLDGKTFTEAGSVIAHGNSGSDVSYSFTDKSINTDKEGVIYYRLRSVDIDNKNQLSEVKIIKIDKKGSLNLAIQTYPNPVTSELRITLPANWQGKKVHYEILNNNGQLAAGKQSSSSSQTETLNVSSLPTGFYIVRVTCDGEMAQQKVIKQ